MTLNNKHEPRTTIELSESKVALCRCWQSKKFPYCDGSHRAYNAEYEDNVGPVIVLNPLIDKETTTD